MKIAISGKGGVGKTFIASVLAYHFLNKGFKVLAIDADPSPNLAINLGLTFNDIKKITPISENFELIKKKTDAGVPGIYNLSFSVEDVIENYSIETPFGVNLIVMGVVRSAGEGCACPANAVIRTLLKHIFTRLKEVVIVDMEAGTEHLGRGTAKHVDLMLIISDSNLKSLEVASKIHDLSMEMGLTRVFMVGNKISNKKEKEAISQFSIKHGIQLIGFVPYDEKIVKADIRGETPLIYASKSKGVIAVREIGEKILNF